MTVSVDQCTVWTQAQHNHNVRMGFVRLFAGPGVCSTFVNQLIVSKKSEMLSIEANINKSELLFIVL